jgi:hypothetical protein
MREDVIEYDECTLKLDEYNIKLVLKTYNLEDNDELDSSPYVYIHGIK